MRAPLPVRATATIHDEECALLPVAEAVDTADAEEEPARPPRGEQVSRAGVAPAGAIAGGRSRGRVGDDAGTRPERDDRT